VSLRKLRPWAFVAAVIVCRELVRSMDGRIWVESEPGRGATFVVELPIAEPLLAGI
jgi:K+-sensing histidine kinase KdpD